MKRIVLVSVLVVAIITLMTSPALAGKPASNPGKGKQATSQSVAVKQKPNQAGAEKVPWNLSGAVMPVPPFGPYGTGDIPGSDTASKLIVNRPNGNTWLTLTGIMRGLAPRTQYTVFISNGYTPYVQTGWDVSGTYTIDLIDSADPATVYPEYLVLTQTGTGITGTFVALDAAGTVSRWNIDSGTVTGDQLTFSAHFQDTATIGTFSATISAPDGALVNGTWSDPTRTGTWASTTGNAVMTYTGDTGWPDLFSASVQPFTFTTTPSGNATWHKNLKMAVLPGPGTYSISAWVNGPTGTLLISDTFSVTR